METIRTHPSLRVMLLSFILVALFSDCLLTAETKNSDPNENSKYLDAVRRFAVIRDNDLNTNFKDYI